MRFACDRQGDIRRIKEIDPVLFITDQDARALNLWVHTVEVPVNTWIRLNGQPNYERPVAVVTPVVDSAASHPNLIAEAGPTDDGAVQVRVRFPVSSLPRPSTVRVQVLLAESRTCPVYDENNPTVQVGRVAFSRRDQDWRVHSTKNIDNLATTDVNEWSDWINTWYSPDQGIAHVWGAYSTGSPNSPHFGAHNNALVGSPFVPANWNSASSVMWASGSAPTDTVARGWTRVGHTAGRRIFDTNPYPRASNLSVVYVDAPSGPIRLGDNELFLGAETRRGIGPGSIAAPAGDFVFANPASLRHNTENWWPCLSIAETGNEVILNGREGSALDIGFVTVSDTAPTSGPTRAEAARFLAQATFGAGIAEVDRVASMGIEAWLDEQHLIEAGPLQPLDATVDGALAYALSPNAPEAHNYSRVKPHLDDLWLYWESVYKKHWNRSPDAADPAPSQANNFRKRGASFGDLSKVESRFPYFRMGGWHSPRGTNCTTQWARNVLRNDDQLRQRVAFALSQIFVVSNVPSPAWGMGMARYQDMLTGLAFGSFRELVRQVTYSPIMAKYLTYSGATVEAADENYARELMQLFTIGLWKLDTTPPPANGGPSTYGDETAEPTYDNGDIEALSRVFTGFSFITELKMRMVSDGLLHGSANLNGWGAGFMRVIGTSLDHDWTLKDAPTVGIKIPASTPQGEPQMFDEVDLLIDQLLEHPNVAPFFCKAMIRFLVTSNPSPRYLYDVAQVFLANNGADDQLFQVVKEILTHDEARSATVDGPWGGRLQDPVVRMTRVLKGLAPPRPPNRQAIPRPSFTGAAFSDQLRSTDSESEIRTWSKPTWPKKSDRDAAGNITRDYESSNPHHSALEADLQLRLPYTDASKRFGQWPYSAPSVFNFFDANYAHPTVASDDSDAVSPEFGVLHGASVIGFPNFILDKMNRGFNEPFLTFTPSELDFSEPLAVVSNEVVGKTIEPLYEWLTLVICNGSMTQTTRTLIDKALAGAADLTVQQSPQTQIGVLKRAIWAAAISPDGAVLR